VAAIAGLPPLGIFMSEFLVVSSTFARQPWLAVPLLVGLLVAFGALIIKLTALAFGPPSVAANQRYHPLVLAPLFVHVALVAVAGIWLPEPLVRWFQVVARLLG
jgi:hydrogenase-4 component F